MTGEGTMRLFRREDVDDSAVASKREKAVEPRKEKQSTTTAGESSAVPNTLIPAGWYPDPNNRAVTRYWDGAKWAERTQPLPPPPPPAPVREQIPMLPAEAPASGALQDTNSDTTDHNQRGETSPEISDDTKAEKDPNAWAGATQAAVGNALAVGTPESWLNAAQTAVVVVEMSYTMQMSTHARQIAEQAAQGAALAQHEADALTEAASEAVRTAERTAQAAEVAEREARDAATAAANARQQAEQLAAALPKAVEEAEVAAQAATKANAKANQLEDVVLRAMQTDTPETWTEAVQSATAVWSEETGNA